MQTRQQAITYGLSFPHTYVEAPFKDPNWELVRVKGSKKAFLWIYEKDGILILISKLIQNGETSGEKLTMLSFQDITKIKNTGIRSS